MDANIFVQMALHGWNTQIGRATKFFDGKTDEQLFQQVAPGKNTLIYLLGHLVAVNDGMISLFGLGERLYASLDEPFLKNADTSISSRPDPVALRAAWKKSNEELTRYFNTLSAEEWFARHTAMTDDDHAREPTRNKMSVLLNRTNHVAYHLGQLVLAK